MKRRVSVWQSVVAIGVVVSALAATYAIQWQKPALTVVMDQGGTRASLQARNAELDRFEQEAAQHQAPAAKK